MIEPNFKIKEEIVTPDYGKFVIEPLETGFGHTLGNALRRVLLTSIPGAAVSSVKITGVKHRFSTITGLKENVVDLLLNIKGLAFKLPEGKTNATVKLSIRGPKEVTGKDLDLTDDVDLVNPDHYLGSLANKDSKLDIEFSIESGLGYSLSEEKNISTLGVIPTDAIFTPVRRVKYDVEATRVGRQTNLDRLILEIWTNGAIEPRKALEEASKLLTSFFHHFYEPKSSVTSQPASSYPAIPDEVLKLTIDELDLPTRIYNSLRNGGIETLGQLLETPKKELMTMRNMGGKSLTVIEEKLKEKGVSLTV